MLTAVRQMLRQNLVMFVLLSVLTGVLYPLLVTGIAAVSFPAQATGSLVRRDGHPAGSRLLGQAFSSPGYFWGRPSATSPQPYRGDSSAASNLAPTNPALADAIAARVAQLREADPGNTRPVPIDLVTASGSGLDPHISPAAAAFQLPRVARARGIPEGRVAELVRQHTEGRTFGVLGDPRVNVLELNLALDGLR
jgi:K+-transporting ATPase ATPase C chain